MTDKLSEYLVFVDESGDHGLEAIDKDYPVFVLAFCIIQKRTYIEQLTPAIQAFKLKHFGHDNVVLHEREIRKDIGDFAFLKSRSRKEQFLDELTDLVAAIRFTLVCTVIRKELLKTRYARPENPYHMALGFGLERVSYYLKSQGTGAAVTHVLVERRGRKEDTELELEFRRVCDGGNFAGERLPFAMSFVHKQANSPGLQLADLVARPVGLSVLRPAQSNRAFQVLEDKLYRSAQGKRDGWGLKCFP
jgi:Protein of unknown function (DUF3800)